MEQIGFYVRDGFKLFVLPVGWLVAAHVGLCAQDFPTNGSELPAFPTERRTG